MEVEGLFSYYGSEADTKHWVMYWSPGRAVSAPGALHAVHAASDRTRPPAGAVSTCRRGTLTRRHRTGQASSLAGAREQPQQQQQQQQRSIVLVFERTRRRRRSDKRPRHHSPIPAHPQRHQSLHVCPPTRLERIIRIISTSCAMPEGSANNVTWSCHYLGPFKAQRQTVE